MIDLLSIEYDDRIKAYSILAKATYRDYLQLKVDGGQKLHIQRGNVRGKRAYETLKRDLKHGCLMPPIVLAAKKLKLDVPKKFDSSTEEKTFLNSVKKDLLASLRANFYILDGQQRTRALEQVEEEVKAGNAKEVEAFYSKVIRLEIWTNMSFGALAYRMLLLNAGQKPMSIKHQIEVLEHSFAEEVKSAVPDLTIVTSLDGAGAKEPGTFRLSSLVQGMYAWIQRSPHLDLRGEILDKLSEEDAVATLSSKNVAREPEIDDYLSLLDWMSAIDIRVQDKDLHSFFNSDTVIESLAAAAAQVEDTKMLHKQLKYAEEKINKQPQEDFLGVSDFYKLKPKIDPKLFNVGKGTRNWITAVFYSYFSGEKKDFSTLWKDKITALLAGKLDADN